MMLRRSLLRVAAAWPATASPRALQPPTGAVLLTVTGAVATTASDRGVELDLAQLDAIDRFSFSANTRWHKTRVTFEGTRGDKLMHFLGATGKEVVATALNNYISVIPIEDFLESGLLLASRIDGRQLTVREKGPLWIVYPFDGVPEARLAVLQSRSVWQLAKLEIR